MHTGFVTTAALIACATAATAAPFETPYALAAVHADFEAQLEQTAAMGGEVGAAARAAAELLGPHNAAQESYVLPMLGLADGAMTGKLARDLQWTGRLKAMEAGMPGLFDSDVNVIIALVELYALADDAGQGDVARMAERMIWHEVNDKDVLYPAAYLIGAAAR